MNLYRKIIIRAKCRATMKQHREDDDIKRQGSQFGKNGGEVCIGKHHEDIFEDGPSIIVVDEFATEPDA